MTLNVSTLLGGAPQSLTRLAGVLRGREAASAGARRPASRHASLVRLILPLCSGQRLLSGATWHDAATTQDSHAQARRHQAAGESIAALQPAENADTGCSASVREPPARRLPLARVVTCAHLLSRNLRTRWRICEGEVALVLQLTSADRQNSLLCEQYDAFLQSDDPRRLSKLRPQVTETMERTQIAVSSCVCHS